MAIEDSRRIALRFREDLWNTGDLALAQELIAPGCPLHGPIPFATDFVRGPEAVGQLVYFYRLAFSGIRIRVEHLVAEEHAVAARWTAHARHTGPLLELPPTGREVSISGIDMLRIDGGRIAEAWLLWDALSLLDQLLSPAEPARASSPAPGPDFLPLLARLRGFSVREDVSDD